MGEYVAGAIRRSAERLAATSDTARLDAELLMAHALGMSRSDMLLRAMRNPAPASFAALVERRAAREPVAHIVGRQEFHGLAFAVTPDTLIPRGDSEVLVDTALEFAGEAGRALDLGTGTGALLLAFLSQRPGWTGIGIDASEAARAVAERNAAALDVTDRADMRRGDWCAEGWSDGFGRFDLILCNPPYVETGAELDPDVRDYEPSTALFAGEYGLDDYRVLLPQLAGLLAPGGVAIFEIGHTQADAVTALADANGFTAELVRDLAERPRVLILREKGR